MTLVCMALAMASLASALDNLLVSTKLWLWTRRKLRTECKTIKPSTPDRAAEPFSRLAKPTATPTAKIIGRLLKAVSPKVIKNFIMNWKIWF